MVYKKFGKLNWDISSVGMGCWNIGNQWGDIDDATSWATIRKAYDCGVNLYDVAESYGIPNGLSEERLGVGLAGFRHDVYIVSKIGHWGKRTGQGVPKNTTDMIRLCCHACMGRLRTDWIDVMLCHEGTIEDPSVYLAAFDELKKAGSIRAYGISTNDLDVIKRFNVDGNCSVVELDYSLLNRSAEEKILPYCIENQIAVLVRGPLAMGLLSGNYTKQTRFEDPVRKSWHDDPKAQAEFEHKIDVVDKLKDVASPGEEMVQAALRYTISNDAATVTIPGAKSPEQMETNAQAGHQLLSNEEKAKLTAL